MRQRRKEGLGVQRKKVWPPMVVGTLVQVKNLVREVQNSTINSLEASNQASKVFLSKLSDLVGQDKCVGRGDGCEHVSWNLPFDFHFKLP